MEQRQSEHLWRGFDFPVFSVFRVLCHCKGKLCNKVKQDGAQWNVYLHLEQMHKKKLKKFQLRLIPVFFFFNNYLHTFAYRDLLSGNKKHFLPGNWHNKKVPLFFFSWTSARSPGPAQEGSPYSTVRCSAERGCSSITTACPHSDSTKQS